MAHLVTSGMTPYETLAALCASAVWHEAALATLARFADLGRTLYHHHYRFARVSPGTASSEFLAYHSAEIPYLCGRVKAAPGFEKADETASNGLQHAWVEFARHGVPRRLDGSPWPAHTEDLPRFTVIADTSDSVPLVVTTVTSMINATRLGHR